MHSLQMLAPSRARGHALALREEDLLDVDDEQIGDLLTLELAETACARRLCPRFLPYN